MTAPRIYANTDSGAPVLTGQVGSLTLLLDAILVDGYGTGMAAKEPLGWTREFAGANKRVYRNDPVDGSGCFLRVVDDGTTDSGGSARSAGVRAYSTMSDIDTGSDVAPTTIANTNGACWVKSISTDGISRPWWAIGTGTAFYLFVNSDSSLTADARTDACNFAGDLISVKPGDTYNFAVSRSTLATYAGGYQEATRLLYDSVPISTSISGANASLAIVRNGVGDPGSVLATLLSLQGATNNAIALPGSAGFAYPNPYSGGVVIGELYVVEGATPALRGRLPGIFYPLHPRPFSDLQVLSGIEGLPDGTSVIAKFHSGRGRFDGFVDRGRVLFGLEAGWE